MPDSRRNPFDGVTDFFTELGRIRSLGVHGGGEHGVEAAERTHASAWVPTTDILAHGDDLVIRVELAGVDPDDVDLRFTHGVLTVSGTRTPDYGDADQVDFYVRERYYGEFRRVITLPEGTERVPDRRRVRRRPGRDHRAQLRHPRREHEDLAGRQVRRRHHPEGQRRVLTASWRTSPAAAATTTRCRPGR